MRGMDSRTKRLIELGSNLSRRRLAERTIRHVVPSWQRHRTGADGLCWCQPKHETMFNLSGEECRIYVHKADIA